MQRAFEGRAVRRAKCRLVDEHESSHEFGRTQRGGEVRRGSLLMTKDQHRPIPCGEHVERDGAAAG